MAAQIQRGFVFRFHTGSIKSSEWFIDSDVAFGFDSILVRLKENSTDRTIERTMRFRFHTGSIKRWQ